MKPYLIIGDNPNGIPAFLLRDGRVVAVDHAFTALNVYLYPEVNNWVMENGSQVLETHYGFKKFDIDSENDLKYGTPWRPIPQEAAVELYIPARGDRVMVWPRSTPGISRECLVTDPPGGTQQCAINLPNGGGESGARVLYGEKLVGIVRGAFMGGSLVVMPRIGGVAAAPVVPPVVIPPAPIPTAPPPAVSERVAAGIELLSAIDKYIRLVQN